jgi:nucleoid-associated protein YgaU
MASYTSTSRYLLTNSGTNADRKDKVISYYSQYTTRQGDSLESIAAKLFNDGTRYWEIADLNPQIDFPDNIPVGTVLRLPR